MNIVGLTTSTADRKRRAGQRIVMGIAGTSVNADERALIRELRPGGFILFARNVEEPEQVRELNRELSMMLPPELPPLRTVDQEGGRVQRVRAPATVWPSMRTVGNVGDATFTHRVASAMARELRAMGFDLDFAPDADVDSNPANPVIGDRSFGRSPEAVGRHVRAFVRGLQHEGVIACAKHFPGHGDTSVDSHFELPVVEKEPPDLDACELRPFRAAIQANIGSVMTAHVMFPAWDEKLPATMSKRILRGVLRERLGYRGVVFSDDMEMKAVRGRWPLDEQLRLATDAGVDLFLCCKEPELQLQTFEGLVRLQEAGKREEDEAIDAVKRLNALRERFFVDRGPQPPMSVVGCAAHAELALKARVEGA